MRKSRLIYTIGSIVIGIAFVLIVYFGLIAGGVIDAQQTKVVFSSGSIEKVYDGEALSFDEWSLVDGELKKGHTAKVIVSGSRTDVGVSDNVFSVTIKDEGGADVTKDYQIEYQPGVLTVSPRYVKLTAGSASKVYDGTPLVCNEYEISDGELLETHVLEANFTDELMNAGNADNRITARVMTSDGADVSINYQLEYISGKLEVQKRPIKMQSQDVSKEYDGTELVDIDWTIAEGDLVEGHSATAVSFGSMTNVGTTENKFQADILDSESVNVTGNYEISYLYGMLTVTPRRLIVTTFDGLKEYDGLPLTVTEWTLTEGTVVDGQTLSVTCTGERTDVGTSENKANYTVVNDQSEDVTANYDVVLTAGALKVTQRPVTILSSSDEKTYDGLPLQKDGFTIDEDMLVDGHVAYVEVYGSQTEAGVGSNSFSVIIKDAELRDMTANYAVNKSFGNLSVYPRPLTVKSGSATVTYTSKPLMENSFEVVGDGLLRGHTVSFHPTAVRADAGTSENTFNVIVYDGNKQDVTKNYDIRKILGKLTVTPRPLTIKTGSAKEIYNGLPLKSSEYEVIGEPVLLGHLLRVVPKHSRTEVGAVDNECDVVVIDAQNKDVTNNYVVTQVEGKLEVLPRLLTFNSDDLSKIYDGTVLKDSNAKLISGELVSNQHYKVTMTGEQTSAGASDNRYIVTILDEYSRPVTANYQITRVFGTLEVKPRALTIKTDSAKRTYDGSALTRQHSQVVGDGVLSGHVLSVTVNGTITDVGTKKNTFSARVKLSNGTDVTTNYLIIQDVGELEIMPRYIALLTPTYYEVYSGNRVTYQTWSYAANTSVLDGHSIDVTVGGEALDAGAVKNAITRVYVSENGRDVTFNYSIEKIEGELIITKRPITVRSESAAKNYDGLVLTNPDWSVVSSTQIVQTHTMEVAISGTRTEVGESLNTIAEVIVKDASGKDVTHNYSIAHQEGSLVIRGAGGSGGAGGDNPSDTDLSDSGQIGADGSPTDALAVRVKSDKSGEIYLRYMSFGDYTGKNWLQAEEYTKLLDEKYSMNYLTGIALKNAGYMSTRAVVEVKGNNYMLPYYMDTSQLSYEIQTSDVKYSGSTASEYGLYYYLYNAANTPLAAQNLGSYTQEEADYRRFVYNKYQFVPDTSKAFFQQFITDNHLDKDDPDILKKVADCIQTSAFYNESYSRSLDAAEDIAVSFLRDFKEGICQHFATAATALFRSLGIPARYVIGYVGQTQSGIWVDITSENAHAWTEVYLDGIGWVQVEVTPARMNLPPTDYTVKPIDLAVQYTSEFSGLYATPRLQGLTALEKLGYTYQATVVGEQHDIGVGESRIESFVLYDPEGRNVTSLFDFNFQPGKLHVYLKELVVTTESLTKHYDGLVLRAPSDGYRLSGTLIAGHKFKKLELTASLTLAGEALNICEVEIVDGLGKDVTDLYRIVRNFGTLTVERRKITITADSASKIYDGSELTCSTYTMTYTDPKDEALLGAMLADGDTITVNVSGKQTNRGRSPNKIDSVSIINANNVNVTLCYEINSVNGWLTVTNS